MTAPLLMIPGPIEVSPAVQEAFCVPPPSHVSPKVIEAFGLALERMREVWGASAASQPFVVAGSGTIAMEMAVVNVVAPGQRAVVVDTGYFSARMAEMLRRRGAQVTMVGAPVGQAPALEEVEAALAAGGCKALFATHVDTSTGVRVDPEALAAAARRHGALSIFDGVCATAAEAFWMERWGADIYLTSSQKAIGLPAGLALMVASPEAMAARRELGAEVPMSVDFLEWLPIMTAYQERRPSYFSTPATNLILALAVSLGELLASRVGELTGMAACFERHRRAAAAMRQGWAAMGLELLPEGGLAASSLSAVCYPQGVGPELTREIAARGVIVAGGLYKGLQSTYFRVGHMGHTTTRPDDLRRTLEAIEGALIACGHPIEAGVAVAAFNAAPTW